MYERATVIRALFKALDKIEKTHPTPKYLSVLRTKHSVFHNLTTDEKKRLDDYVTMFKSGYQEQEDYQEDY